MDFFQGYKFLAVVLLDVVLGDPRWFPHPVRLMGAVIVRCEERIFLFCQSPITKRLAGVVLALGLPCGCYFIVWELIRLMDSLSETLGLITWIVLGYTTLAARDLWDHATHVYRAMTEQGFPAARLALSQIVGRDTANLSESDIVRATIESVSENTSDGIVAPLFYLALGGPSLAMAYKAVNTLDSMIGYRNARYQDLGWASARLDDLVNWIPARLTAVGISLAAAVRSGQGGSVWRICWRDAGKHLSPNSGWPEAAMAGALGIQLGGVNEYGGRVEERATLGDFGSSLTSSFIPLALQLMVFASFLLGLMLLFLVVLW
jgi:adenosylcobinamide-phosphate synthase